MKLLGVQNLRGASVATAPRELVGPDFAPKSGDFGLQVFLQV